MTHSLSVRPLTNVSEGRADPIPTRVDVAITGGGMIGMTLAIALAKADLSVALIDALGPAISTAPAFDGRVSAIAFASCRLLDNLGLWARLAGDAQPINDILVSDGRVRDGAAPFFLHFDHREIGDAPLGHLVENRHVRVALFAEAANTPRLHVIAPARVSRVSNDATGSRLHYGEDRVLQASLVVVAEGRDSQLRAQAGIKTIGWHYPQTGIVATVAHERPHNGVAQEYFLPSGPFAILPMTGNRASLVWTERNDLAPSYLALDEPAFDHEVARRFGSYLGATKVVGPRWSYPLSLQLARTYVAPRLALVGDAAHSIHPIAGQGLNLGVRDVAALAEVLVDAARLGLDIGGPDVLGRYQRWRRFDTIMLAGATDGLNRLFSSDFAPLRLARGLGLDLVGRVGPARRFFMRLAGGGEGALPRLLRGEPL